MSIINEVEKEGRSGLGRRHLQMMLLFFAGAVSYACRISLSVCIVEMTDRNGTRGFPTYEWDQSQRGVVLSAFFWGYVLMQVPGGLLAHRYGPKRLLLLGVSGCGVLSLIVPLVAGWGWRPLCALRMMQGLVQGMLVPSTQTMLTRWVPPVERGRAGAAVYSGASFGTVAVMAGAGWLASTPLGWPAGFYVPGALGLVWGLAWLLLGADTPATCRAISWEERDYIERALGSVSSGEKRLAIPWLSMLTSVPVISLGVVHSAQMFGHWMLLTQIPNYMKEVLHFDIKQNGLYSALPYLCLLAASTVTGWVSQVVNERGILYIGASRKVFNSLAHYCGGVTLLVLALTSVSTQVAVALLTVVVALESCTLTGFMVNHVDLSPNFGGTLMGLTNGVGNIMGIVAPIFVSLLLGDTSSATEQEIQSRWGTAFIFAACVYFVGNTIFILGGSGEVQPWNFSLTSETKDDQLAGTEMLPKEKTASELA